jgi:hypothetical protein
VQTIFPRPRYSRGLLAPAGVAQFSHPVTTFDELVAALGRIQSTFSTGEAQNPLIPKVGGEIVICRPIECDRTIKLPASCTGVRIIGAGRLMPLIFTELVARAFLIDAAAVEIANLWIVGKTTAHAPQIAFEIDAANTSQVAGQECIIRENIATCDRLFVDTVGAIDGTLERNTQVGRNDVGSSIEFAGRMEILRNKVDPSASYAGIEMTSGSYARVVGNDLQGGDIDTSASSGSNVVHGNVRVENEAMPNLHASDSSAGNMG